MDFFSKKNRILLKELIKTDFKLRYQGSLGRLSLVDFEAVDDVYYHVSGLCPLFAL